MAIKLLNREYNMLLGGTINEYICDTDADFDTLPEANTGSMALSVATGTIKVVNASGEWVDFA